MLIHKQNVMLEARIQVRFEAEVDNDRVVVTIDMGIDAIHAFEDLEEERLERLRERYTCRLSVAQSYHVSLRGGSVYEPTNSAWKHLFIVDIALHPRHQMLNVLWRRHLCRLLEVLIVLP